MNARSALWLLLFLSLAAQAARPTLERALACRRGFAVFGFPLVAAAAGPRYVDAAQQQGVATWRERYVRWRAEKLRLQQEVQRDDIELPPVPKGYVRLMHVTGGSDVGKTLETGLHYENWGTLAGTASAPGATAKSAHLPGTSFLIMDIPEAHYQWHMRLGGPGLVPTEYIIGWFDHRDSFAWNTNSRYDPKNFAPPKVVPKGPALPPILYSASRADAAHAKRYFSRPNADTPEAVRANVMKAIPNKSFRLRLKDYPPTQEDEDRMAAYRVTAAELGYEVGDFVQGNGVVEAKLEKEK